MIKVRNERGTQMSENVKAQSECSAAEEAERRITVDVIIPAYKPGSAFKELLRRLLWQTCPIQHVIVMNTEKEYWDEDAYAPLFEDKKTKLSVVHIAKAEFDHGGTRHLGMELSEADVCVCMTQDAIPRNRELLENLIMSLYTEPSVAVSYARQLPAADCGFVERLTRAFNYPEESRIKSEADAETLGIKAYFCSNVCAAYKRELYLELGGFIRKTIFNEDMIFAAKAAKNGYKIAYAADAQVIHSHNYTAIEQLHRNFDLAVSQADHPEAFAGVASEGEGLRLVKATAVCLMKRGKCFLLPELIIKSGFKYAGFRLGKIYRRLPASLVRRLTMNQAYWD